MFFQIDGHVIRHMTDEELAKFIPLMGHRILVRQFVKNDAKQTEKPNQSERKRHLMDRIKIRLKQKENRNLTLGVGKKSKKKKKKKEVKTRQADRIWTMYIRWLVLQADQKVGSRGHEIYPVQQNLY